MATLIFVDKENGGVDAQVAPKDRMKLGSVSSIKSLSERCQTSTAKTGKVFAPTPAPPKSVRKVLGNVNRTLETARKKNEPIKQKDQLIPPNKITEKTAEVENCVPVSDETYPEIEKLFSFDPLDFESFDVPEEHRLSHLPLTGVPLLILDKENQERFDDLAPSPVKVPHLPWEAALLRSTSSLLSTMDDMELPPVCYDLNI
ncbi:securin [Ornithorhynchus anatinus]|uniref:Securin n=1 Tax=Ornithorhynchus anatinus TaxID=9258 RepID=F6VVC4_ORNAN|nr:securin [Ornithorhynchus anatinus]